MSHLQIALALAGAVVLLLLAGQAAWRFRKSQPRQALDLTTPDAPDTEPLLDVAAFDAASFPTVLPEKRPALDALIDVLTPIALEAPVSGEAALAALPATRRAGSKPYSIEGFNEPQQRWEVPLAGQRYAAFQAGVQLANRSGALNEIEFSEFVMKTQSFCDAINGTPDFPDMLQEVARAREIDQFASEHDAQLGIVVRAQSAAWSPGYVQQNAASLGFVAGSIPGRMVLPASVTGMPALLGLSVDAQAALADDPSQSAIHQLALSLDVAQVDRREHAFERLREVAQALAQRMDGVVTDDKGMALTPPAMDLIGVEIERLYDSLEARDLAAGSAQARRLFS